MSLATLWFSADPCTVSTGHVVYWRKYLSGDEAEQSTLSLPQLVYDDSERWRALYLGWLDELAKSSVGRSNLEHRLRLRPNLSYWWMTIPSEFSFSEDSIVYKAVRIWAFVEVAERLGFTEIHLVGADPDVADSLRAWGQRTHREITAEGISSNRKQPFSIRTLLSNSSNICIQIAFALRRLCMQYVEYGPIRNSMKQSAATVTDELTIVDDLAHLQVEDSQGPRYRSHYWGELPALLNSQGKSVHWVHMDHRSARVTSVHDARSIVRSMQDNFPGQRHSLLEDSLDTKVLFKAVASFLQIMRLGYAVGRSGLDWQHEASGIDMWPLAKLTWRRAFFGTAAAQNALWLRLLDLGLGQEHSRRTCLYLMENQSWELALLSNWTNPVPGTTLGVIHGSVRKWDIRYGLGFSTSHGGAEYRLPRPSAVLVSGPEAHIRLREFQVPANELIHVEALRYVRGSEVSPRPAVRDLSTNQKPRLLALGEYDAGTALVQVDLLNRVQRERGAVITTKFRPHPGAVHDLSNLDTGIKLSSSESIREDLAQSDLVLCSSVSTAALDALLAGVRTIVYRDGAVLDGQMVPIEAGSVSVTSTVQLMEAIDDALNRRATQQVRGDGVFNLDAELPGWLKVISDFT